MPFHDSMIDFLEKGGIRGAFGLEPETELKASTIPSAIGPVASIGQSAFQNLVAPFIGEIGGFAGKKLGKFIEDDEEFQELQKSNPELAAGLLKIATATPTALGAFATSLRGLNRSAGSIRANQPGQARELMKKMRQSSTDDLIDDLIKMGQKNPQKDTILNMRGSKVDERLEDFLRR